MKTNRSTPRALIAAFAAAAATLSTSAIAHATPTVTYYGGPLVSTPRVVEVFWTSGVDATLRNQVSTFWSTFLDSTYMDGLGSEYSAPTTTPTTGQRVGRGFFASAVTITPSVTATSLTDTQILTELKAQIAAGVLPAPTRDALGYVTTIYAVEFPASYTITLSNGAGTSCQSFCAATDAMQIDATTIAPVMLFPDEATGPCSTGCGNGAATGLDRATIVHSIELVNAVTSPQVSLAATLGPPIAWYANDPTAGSQVPVGELCAAATSVVGGFSVAKYWSRSTSACALSNPTLPPLCTATTSPPACRACTPGDCRVAPNTLCDQGASDATYGRCVACLASSDCPASTPKCDRTTGSCVGCVVDTDCTMGICDPVSQQCVSASADAGSDAADASVSADAADGSATADASDAAIADAGADASDDTSMGDAADATMPDTTPPDATLGDAATTDDAGATPPDGGSKGCSVGAASHASAPTLGLVLLASLASALARRRTRARA